MTSLARFGVLEKQCRYLPSYLSSSSFRLLREGFFTRKDFGISPWRPRVVLHTKPTTHLATRQLRRGIPPSCLRWRYQQISFPSIRVSPTTPNAAPSLNVLLILRCEHARARTRCFKTNQKNGVLIVEIKSTANWVEFQNQITLPCATVFQNLDEKIRRWSILLMLPR